MASQQIILDHSGPVTHSSMEEQLRLLREHPRLQKLRKAVRKRLYGVAVELMDNIRKYASAGGNDSVFRIELSGKKLLVRAGNLLDKDLEASLTSRLDRVNGLDEQELRGLYEQVINQEGHASDTGAGLGLITLAMRSEGPLHYSFEPAEGGKLLYKIWIYLKT